MLSVEGGEAGAEGVACAVAAASDASAHGVAAAAPLFFPVPPPLMAAVCVGGQPYACPRRCGLADKSQGAGPRRRQRGCGRARRADRLVGAATGHVRVAGDLEQRRRAGTRPARAGGGEGVYGWCAWGRPRRGCWHTPCRHHEGSGTARRPAAGQRRAPSRKSTPRAALRGMPQHSKAWRAPESPGRREEGGWGGPCQGAPRRPSPSLTA